MSDNSKQVAKKTETKIEINDDSQSEASAQSLNVHGTITTANRAAMIALAQKYKPARIELAKHVETVLNKLGGLTFTLDGGTLLGAWRSGEMIPHDDDFDLLLYVQDILPDTDETKTKCVARLGELCERIKPLLDARYSVRIVSSYTLKLEVFEPAEGAYPFRDQDFPGTDYHNVTVDLQLVLEAPTYDRYMHTDMSKLKFKKGTILPPGKITFEGLEWPAPADVEGYLTEHYGYLGAGAVFNKETQHYEPPPSESKI